MFLASFMNPWKVEVIIPPPIIPPPMPPPTPLPPMEIPPPLFIAIVIVGGGEIVPLLPIIWENVLFPLASTTECPNVQSREPGLPEDMECITQSPIMSEGEKVAVVVFIMTHNSGLLPFVSVATIMVLSIDMTP